MDVTSFQNVTREEVVQCGDVVKACGKECTMRGMCERAAKVTWCEVWR